MEKKKKSFFAKLKDKFSKKDSSSKEEYEEGEYEEEYEYEEVEEEVTDHQEEENIPGEPPEHSDIEEPPVHHDLDEPSAIAPPPPKMAHKTSKPKFEINKVFPNFKFSNIVKDFFSPTNRKFLHKIFQVFLTISICYTIGKTGALILKKAFPSKIKRSTLKNLKRTKTKKVNLSAISGKNLFNIVKKKQPKAVVKKARVKKVKKILSCDESRVKSSLPIKLINTIVLQNSKKSLAIVKAPGKKKIQSLREGDMVKGLAKIGKIKRLRVILLNSKKNTCEYIENRDKRFEKKYKKKKIKVLSKKEGKKALKKKKKGISSVGNSFKIKKSVRDAMLKDIQNVLTQARAVQIKNPDGSLSFKMTDIVPGSIYSQLDISDGDIISEINGKKIENINEILTLFGKIKDIDNLSLTILKDGQKQEKDYEFQ